MAHMVQFFFGRVENMVRKGENAGYQHFLLFPQCFQSALTMTPFDAPGKKAF